MTELDDALISLSETVLDAEEPRDLAITLISLQKFRANLNMLIDQVHQRLANLMKKPEMDLGEGIGFIRRSRDVRSTWNHHELLREVVDQHKEVNEETGELYVNGFELAN